MGQRTCLLTKHTRRWAYSWYFFPACCLLRFAAFLFFIYHRNLPCFNKRLHCWVLCVLKPLGQRRVIRAWKATAPPRFWLQIRLLMLEASSWGFELNHYVMLDASCWGFKPTNYTILEASCWGFELRLYMMLKASCWGFDLYCHMMLKASCSGFELNQYMMLEASSWGFEHPITWPNFRIPPFFFLYMITDDPL